MSRLCTGITAFPAARHRMAQKPLQLIPENVVLIFFAVSKCLLGDHLTQVPQLTFHPLSDLLGGATDLTSGLHGVKNLFHGYHLTFNSGNNSPPVVQSDYQNMEGIGFVWKILGLLKWQLARLYPIVFTSKWLNKNATRLYNKLLTVLSHRRKPLYSRSVL
nr:MAG TPA: hypothetical protein [Bacteriophage sp.]